MTENTPSEAMVEAMARAICSADPEIRMGDAERVVQQRVAAEWRNYLPAALAAATVIAEALAAKDAQLAELSAEIAAAYRAMRWVYRNGMKPDYDRPAEVSNAFDAAFSVERAALGSAEG